MSSRIRIPTRRTWTGPAMAAAASLIVLALSAGGCTNEAYCFYDCGDSNGASSSNPSGSGTGGSGTGGIFISSSNTGTASGGGAPCELTNGGNETCDAVDNDCNGVVDDIPDLDLTSTKTCGTCENNCNAKLAGCDITKVTCAPGMNPGKEPGKCSCAGCAPDLFDLDNNGTCEYYCKKSADDDTICNNKDDDCDGLKDENVKLCESTTDCGKCGNNCVVLNGTAKCDDGDGNPGVCDASKAACAIAKCNDNGPGDRWWDLDGKPGTGCEYQCDLTNGGVEVCGDGADNDCDGKIDSADDLSGDPSVGQPCHGDPDGVCATAAHEGVTQCVGQHVVCVGANVLTEADADPEICNGQDDDCDGVVDDNPTDVGKSCGQSNLAPCSFGIEQCVNGALACVGAVNPVAEVCDGIDNDCDGAIDKTGSTPPADATGPCDVPPAPPPGATQPCKAGSKACVGGAVVCQGSIKPQPGAKDACDEDTDCDGLLTNQPDLTSDVSNCGACGNDCYAGAVHSNWSCQNKTCQFLGCESGFYDPNGDKQCEYACVFISSQESCNGVDDDCDDQIDEDVANIPSPTQVCGVSLAASAPECTTGVTVTCQGGAWNCSFPAGVCSPDCDNAAEICDGLDNNCDGSINENVTNYNQPCASDDDAPVPGHGACRKVGQYVCNGPNATICSATKADCNTLPGGCTEHCDGIDNDCDGSIDEPFTAKGTNTANFVKPAVTKINAAPAPVWIYSYEASRPSAKATSSGNGNGYYNACTTSTDPPCNGYSAPAGETLDKTPACSVPGRVPWFNVSPVEVIQTCKAMGGTVCDFTSQWKKACESTASCGWGYAPHTASCTTGFNAAKFCNLGSTYDYSPGTSGDQDGLLPTASPALKNCWADWLNVPAGDPNPAGNASIYDITGNLREITITVVTVNGQPKTVFPLMGGSFVTQTEDGARCGFSFYSVDESFKFFDTGFRCCFTSDPTL